ncbi:hypothetical protein L0128_02820 [candidate division KSB1 bacterium]|nr:hypothetical protein [candidate division KSB1 bacterium]
MQMETTGGLKSSLKFSAIHAILSQQPLNPIIDNLTIPEIIDFQKYVWDLTVEFGLKIRGKNFSRNDVTRNMTATAIFQIKMGCTEKIYYCKATHCIKSNPQCAIRKIKEQVEIMAEVIRDFIRNAPIHEMVV